jgi:hypothetical protein
VSMRHASNMFTLGAATMFALLISSVGPSTAEYDCVYRGTAPTCAGKCLSGEVERGRGANIDGNNCFTGTKVLCCKPGLNPRIEVRTEKGCGTGARPWGSPGCTQQHGAGTLKEKSTAAGQVKQPKGSETFKEKTTAAEEVKQRKGAGSLKLPTSTAGEKETTRPVPTR